MCIMITKMENSYCEFYDLCVTGLSLREGLCKVYLEMHSVIEEHLGIPGNGSNTSYDNHYLPFFLLSY